MTPDEKALKVRKVIMPAIETYEKTISPGKPHGCKEALTKVVRIYDEFKQMLSNQMPTANKIGYGHVRDRMNDAMRHHNISHSY
jgi:hypothetical protein